MNKQIEIFLSYSWNSKTIADKIFHDLSFIGFNIIKDDHKLKYTDKLSEFMKGIRSSDYAILIICDSYLKSINCMTEVLELQKDENIWKKILPVICDNTNIFEIEKRIKYVNYWQDKAQSIEIALKNLDPINATSIYEELKSYKIITQNIDGFLTGLKNELYTTPKELFDKYYRPLTDKIGIEPDFRKMLQLIPISYIVDPQKRLIAVNEFINQNTIENSYIYAILASCYKDMKKYKQAKKYYDKSLELDKYNYASWNNLGEIYNLGFNNFTKAKYAYEKAIEINPNLDIPRLNLGILLKEKFKDVVGAKEQYEAILKFDENNPKAHNNLANIYKLKSYFNLDKAEEHFLIAVSQDNLEAVIGYANFLKIFRKKIELGNKYYEKAKELDKNNVFAEIIDILMKSEKS